MTDTLPEIITLNVKGAGQPQADPDLFGRKHDPSTTVPVGPYAHGPSGIFAQAGQDDSVFSAMLLPIGGLTDALPVLNNADDGPDDPYGDTDVNYFTTITGVTQGGEAFTDQPTAACAEGAPAGLLKVCTLVSTFGRYRFRPNSPIEVFRAGRRRDRADPMTLRLMNMAEGMQQWIPDLAGVDVLALNNELSNRLFTMGVSMQRFMQRRIWVGSPANNNGAARDIVGMDIHINAGNKVDAFTQNLCTAMDSDMKSFGSSMVHGAVRDIQNYAETMFQYLDWNSTRMFGSPWDGAIVMRPDLWNEITKVISVRQYQEAILQASLAQFTNARLLINGKEALDFRNMMRTTKVWPLAGRLVPVILDTGITERNVTNNALLQAGQYSSDIYFVPLRVLGGVPVTYWKYFKQDNGNSEAIARIAGQVTFVTDNGMFRWHVGYNNGCLTPSCDFSPRLIMRTPQLAGRIQDVGYAPLQHFRSEDPTSVYFADGGRTTGLPQQFYAEWSTSTPTQVA